MRSRKEPRSDPFDEITIIENINVDDDEEGPTITVRGVAIGMLAGALGAASSQMFMFKPVHLKVDPLFIQLLCLVLSRLLALIPGPIWWNPGPVLMKETVFSAIMASSAAGTALAVEGVATQRLFFNKELSFFATGLTILSTQLIGLGMAGENDRTKAQVSYFKKALLAISLYEIFPTYIAPALVAISPWCLTLPQIPEVTNLFGGSMAGEGMGLLAISADWMLVGHHGPMFVPLASQMTEWAGYIVGIFLCMAAFRNKWFGGPNLPFIAYDMYDDTAKPYNLTAVVFENGTPNLAGIAKLGLPSYTPTIVLCKALLCSAASASITIALFYSFFAIKEQRKNGPDAAREQKCPHRAVTERLPDFPTLGYIILFVVSVVMAVIASQVGQSGLSLLGLFVAITFSSVFGIAFPGNVHANLWFTLYGSTTVSQCTFMLKDLKLGQYMHLAPLSIVIAQLGGTLLGAIIQYLVMITIVRTQHDTLLLPHGNGVFTGMYLSLMASEATSWGIFSRELYFPGKKYAIVPFFLLLGFVSPLPFLIFGKIRPASRLSLFNPSCMVSAMAHSMLGATSGRTMGAVIGFTSQYVMRKYHFNWYKKYNYVLCAALDGGTQITVLLLGFIFQGGAGLDLKFPTYALNPQGPRDYCFMAGAGGKSGHGGHH
ncbi:hypothetical protein CROQUDRAFT_58749 [Cronartium quercuum f. sp. fusiforme G11]|uniref:Oligopeptide transporter n=1 Tax=Cronartium quercuum f. sp. fusiforme G11 TaxID=708437 RepID=A0A9P6NTD3_9BASI|nr:hypothetical protein CROQUDRAFT_58749 [Cronartium quercuum f. sp. fusiforme G11]